MLTVGIKSFAVKDALPHPSALLHQRPALPLSYIRLFRFLTRVLKLKCPSLVCIKT